MKATMEEFCTKVGHIVYASKPGFYVPTVYLVGDEIDPTKVKDVAGLLPRAQTNLSLTTYSRFPMFDMESNLVRMLGK